MQVAARRRSGCWLGAVATVSAAIGCSSIAGVGRSSASTDAPLYESPLDWDVHTVAASVEQGTEPLNFILASGSTVSMPELVTALAGSSWLAVGIGTGIEADLLDDDCISAETASVDAANANEDQSVSLRVNGCSGIVDFTENHARAYPQASGAWFVAVAKEYPCLVAAWPPWWHCIAGDGYDTGRDEFLAAVQAAAQAQGWSLQCETDSRPSGTGLNGVVYDGSVYVCSLDGGGPSSTVGGDASPDAGVDGASDAAADVAEDSLSDSDAACTQNGSDC